MDDLIRFIMRILYYVFIFWIVNLIFNGSARREQKYRKNSEGHNNFDEGFQNQEEWSNRGSRSSNSSYHTGSTSLIDEAYVVFGLTRKASDAEIKKKYRELANKYHPDKNPNDIEAQAEMTKINNAYEIITESRKTQKH